MQVRCRKCRCVLLASEQDVEGHDARASKPLDFVLKDYRSRGTGVMEGVSCSHLFTKELPWMEGFIRGVSEGIIGCPKCGAKLGTFSWVGVQCSCGGWQVPGFALLRAKIDVIQTGP